MLDFKELGVSGDDFEILVRELLYNKGLEVYWSGKGADGGKDLLCIEKPLSNFKSVEKRWVVQCKHNANKGRAVSPGEVEGGDEKMRILMWSEKVHKILSAIKTEGVRPH